MHGFELVLLPVTAPGVEQKATWLQVRQQRPDYTLLWGWGVMNSTALKEAVATGYPREKLFGVWWSGAEPDVKDVGANAKGYSALALNPHGTDSPLVKDILKKVHDAGQGAGPREEVGSVLYMRGLLIQMFAVEAVRTAQAKFGTGKVMTGEQVRWGLENLNIDEKRIGELGLAGLIRPLKTSCTDHMGSSAVRVHSWDGSQWKMQADWYEADKKVIDPMVKEAADRYAAEKQIKRRDASDCNA